MTENTVPTPRIIAARIGMRRVSMRLAALDDLAKRHQLARAKGAHGPLTRAEVARRAAQ